MNEGRLGLQMNQETNACKILAHRKCDPHIYATITKIHETWSAHRLQLTLQKLSDFPYQSCM